MPKVEGLREKGHWESRGRGVSWHFECTMARLKRLAAAEHRLMQHGVESHPLQEEGRVQPKQLGVALSGDSFCGVWRKTSSEELILLCGLEQALGERSLQERGGVWGAVEQELGGREEGPLQRQGGAGR